MSVKRTKRLGIDVGGTYTDLVLLDTRTKKLDTLKVLSTPHDFLAVSCKVLTLWASP